MLPIRQRNSFRNQLPAYAVFSVFVLWLGALAASAYTEGMNLLAFLQAFSTQFSQPLALKWTPHSLKFLAGAMGIYIITGGAIKLTRTMQEREHTLQELEKMEKVRNFLIQEHVFDEDSFTNYQKEVAL